MWFERKETEKQLLIAHAYTEYNQKLRIFIRASMGKCEMVEDIIQDVFVEALRKYEVFSVHPNQIGWLYLTARHKIQEYERRKRRSRIVGGDLNEEFVMLGEQEKGYFESEFSQTVIGILTPEEWLRFKRFFLWGYSVEELAAKEGITVNNMRVRLSRLKRKILEEMNDIGT